MQIYEPKRITDGIRKKSAIDVIVTGDIAVSQNPPALPWRNLRGAAYDLSGDPRFLQDVHQPQSAAPALHLTEGLAVAVRRIESRDMVDIVSHALQ